MEFKKVHEDERGQIYAIGGMLTGDREIALLVTKRGYARGGCIHRRNPEFFIVLSGQVSYHIAHENEQIVGVGEAIEIPPGMPHYFETLMDTVAMEWGTTASEREEYDTKLRRLVEEINRRHEGER